MTTATGAPPIQTVRSILAPATVAAIVAQDYAGGEVDECILHSARIHDHYLVRRGERWSVLRVYDTSHARLVGATSKGLFELAFLDHLSREGAPVAAPEPRRDGRLQGVVAAPEGDRIHALFQFFEGRPAFPPEPGTARRLGEELAATHRRAAGYRGDPSPRELDLEALLERPLAHLREVLGRRRPQDAAFLEELAAQLRERVPDPSSDPEAYGLVAGGFTVDNHHWCPQAGPRLFGFAQAGRGWRAFDVGVFLWSARLVGLSPEVCESFVAGYHAVRPLAEEEREALPSLAKLKMIHGMAAHVELTRTIGIFLQDDAYWDRHLGPLRAWGDA